MGTGAGQTQAVQGAAQQAVGNLGQQQAQPAQGGFLGGANQLPPPPQPAQQAVGQINPAYQQNPFQPLPAPMPAIQPALAAQQLGGGLFGLGNTGQLPPGIDPRAVAANPQGYQQWLAGAQAQESKMPGSTMLAPQPAMSPQFPPQGGMMAQPAMPPQFPPQGFMPPPPPQGFGPPPWMRGYGGGFGGMGGRGFGGMGGRGFGGFDRNPMREAALKAQDSYQDQYRQDRNQAKVPLQQVPK